MDRVSQISPSIGHFAIRPALRYYWSSKSTSLPPILAMTARISILLEYYKNVVMQLIRYKHEILIGPTDSGIRCNA